MKIKFKVQSSKFKIVVLSILGIAILTYFIIPVSAQTCPTQSIPRVQEGLISAPNISPNFSNNTRKCVIDDKASFAPFKIPSYDDLKSLYFNQAKESASVNKQTHTGQAGAANLNTYLSANKNLIYINGGLEINGNISGSNSAIIFVMGDLKFTSPMTQFTYGSTSSGIVFVVKGNVLIDKSVTQINAVIISQGVIYTATETTASTPIITCPTSSVNVGATTNALTVNGSLISLNQTDLAPIKFCRTLTPAGNTTSPAEIINHQPKYLVILRDLFSNTLQKWSEVQ